LRQSASVFGLCRSENVTFQHELSAIALNTVILPAVLNINAALRRQFPPAEGATKNRQNCTSQGETAKYVPRCQHNRLLPDAIFAGSIVVPGNNVHKIQSARAQAWPDIWKISNKSA